MEKRYLDSYKRIVSEANRLPKNNLKGKNLKSALSSQNISVERKKQQLMKLLHSIILSTLSFDSNSASGRKKALAKLKNNSQAIRLTIHKLKSINNYLEEAFLRELGLVKKPLVVRAASSRSPEKFLEKERKTIDKNYLGLIEHTIYKLMHEIVFFDEKLFKNYSQKEVKVINKEKLEIKDLKNILKRQSELFDALEAKMPPKNNIKSMMFTKQNFHKWAPLAFALLSSIEAECGKENSIFLMVKRNKSLRAKIEKKIRYVAKEKEKMLKLKEKRILAMEKIGKIEDDYRNAFHDYVSASSL